MEIPDSWRVHKETPFDVINEARRNYRIGMVFPPLRKFLETAVEPIDVLMLANSLYALPRRNKTPQQFKDLQAGILFSYIEGCPNLIKRPVIKAFMTFDNRLLCDNVACLLLNSGNIPAVQEMESCGYVPTEELAKEFTMCLVDADYSTHEMPETIIFYAPVVDYLVSKGFSHIINGDILFNL